jgi:hypothetical protein
MMGCFGPALRRPAFYPAELRARGFEISDFRAALSSASAPVQYSTVTARLFGASEVNARNSERSSSLHYPPDPRR